MHVARSVLPDDEASRGAVTFADGTYVSHDQLDFIFDVSCNDYACDENFKCFFSEYYIIPLFCQMKILRVNISL